MAAGFSSVYITRFVPNHCDNQRHTAILTVTLGSSVLLIRSPTAIAQTKEAWEQHEGHANQQLSITCDSSPTILSASPASLFSAPHFKICTGCNDACTQRSIKRGRKQTFRGSLPFACSTIHVGTIVQYKLYGKLDTVILRLEAALD